MQTYTIGGVPEHFNYPWHLAIEHQLFAQHAGFEVAWRDFPGGTGAMLQALEAAEIDAALVLTEGALKRIAGSAAIQIVGTYVRSPLTWGVHVHANSPFHQVEDLPSHPFAISRLGSGSHLMSYVYAKRNGWDLDALRFELVGNLDGARKALLAKKAGGFLWEKFTTKPLVDSGEWRRIDLCPTPWPCFVMVTRTATAEQHGGQFVKMMAQVRHAMHLLDQAETYAYISQKYTLQLSDVQTWFAQTEWLCKPEIYETTIVDTQQTLQELGLIETPKAPQDIVTSFTRLTHDQLSQVMYDWRVESVYKKLAEQGKSEGPLVLEDLLALGHLDQYHYLGAATSYEIASQLQLQDTDQVLDIGCGVGGTSRVIASISGCEVLGMDIQDQLISLATELTERVGLAKRVTYQAGDFLEFDHKGSFDYLLSLMVFLHMPKRPLVLQKCYDLLKPGGQLYIEDFVALKGSFTEAEQHALTHTVSTQSVTPRETYIADLQVAGFEKLEIQDMTEPWKAWTAKRFEDFVADEAANKAFFGPELYDHRASFYETIKALFQGGNLGGIRILATKPE